jgi:photosystem II stability/assembly factor-like uncharacterized protein
MRNCILTLLLTLIIASTITAQNFEPEGLRGDEMPALSVGPLRLAPEFPAPGEPTQVEAEILNRSTAAVTNVSVALVVDGNRVTETATELGSGAARSVRLTWQPSARGAHVVTLIADPDHRLIEQNLLDNSASANAVVLRPPPAGADFRIRSLALLNSKVAIRVANRGTASGDAPVVLRVNGKSAEVRRLGKLPSGLFATIEIPWPADALPAVLSAEVNPRYRSAEANRSDNVATIDMRPAVDLRIRNLSVATHATAQHGQRQITISFQVVNSGQRPITTPFRTSIVPGPASAQEGTPLFVPTASLPAGKAVAVSHTIVRPEGDFDVRVVADADDVVAEDLENNNIATYRYTNPTPDVDRWVSIGPDFMAIVNSVGELGSIALDPSSPSTIYVSSHTSGVWKTTDGGTSWMPMTDSLGTLDVSAIAIDPLTPSTVYIATPAQGVFRSETAGTSWMQVSGSAALGIAEWNEVLLEHPTDPDVLYLTSANGVYRSDDRGETWVLSKSGSGTDLVLSADDPKTLYAGIAGKGIYKTVTGGVGGDAAWTLLTSGLPVSDVETVHIAQVVLIPTHLFALFRITTSDKKAFYFELYFSPDAGTTWTKTYTFSESFYLATLAANIGHDIVYVAGVDLFRSNTGATAFTQLSGPHVDHHAFAATLAAPGTLYTACDGGIYRTTNGGDTWDFLGRGIRNAEFYDHAVSDSDLSFVLGGTQDNGTVFHELSDSWGSIGGGDGATVAVDSAVPVLFSMDQFPVKLGFTVGTTGPYTGIGKELPNDHCFNAYYQLHPAFPKILLLSCDGLWRRSLDGDPPTEPWHKILPESPGDPAVDIVRSAVDGGNDLYYAGSSSGVLYIARGGAGWSAVFTHPDRWSFTDIELDPFTPEILYASFDGDGIEKRIYRRAPGKMEDITGNLPPRLPVKTLAVDRGNPFTIYAGTPNGIYRGRSNDGTIWTWESYDLGLPQGLDVTDLEVQPVSGYIRAATFGRGVYEVRTY